MSATASAPGAQQQRFAAYLDSLAQAAEHADRAGPLKSYCKGLLPLERDKRRSIDQLEAFGWQLCEGHTVRHVKKWLRTDAFPTEIVSSELINKLFDGSIGTDDQKIIERVIDPPESEVRSVTIRIFWPDGEGPPPSFPLRLQQQVCQQVQQRVRA